MNQHKRILLDKNFKPVDVPFKAYIPPGHSTFQVLIPKSFNNREFHFTYAVLLPDFYSNQAAEMNIDTDDELDDKTEYEIYYNVTFLPTNKFYPGIYIPLAGTVLTTEIAKSFNDFFESGKPNGAISLGSFFDWYDIRFDDAPENVTFKDWVEKLQALNYYGEAFNVKKHFNALPPSARKIENSNNYLFPTKPSPDTLKSLRFRINIAVNTRVNFSTDGHLLNMGFSSDQLGERTGSGVGQFVLRNNESNLFYTLEAEHPPVIPLSVKAEILRVRMELIQLIFISDTIDAEMSKRNFPINEQFENEIKAVLELIGTQCNLRTGFEYDKIKKIFKFTFPENVNITSLKIMIPTELAQRLGYGLVSAISRRNAQGQPVLDKPDVKDAHEKAMALSYDTGIVVISDNNTSSNTTSGIFEHSMANLYPTVDGQMVIPSSDICNNPPTMKISTHFTESNEFIPITFKLSRFLEHNKLVNLIWKVGAYVTGNLKGILSEN